MTTEKISYKQALILFLLSILSPTLRLMPTAAAQLAKGPGWITPLFTIPVILTFIFVLNAIFKKYNKQSYVDILKDFFGKYIGAFICLIMFVYFMFLTIYDIRSHAVRLLAGVIPGFDYAFLSFLILAIVIYVISKGIVPLARMAELFFVVVLFILVASALLISPKIKIDNLFPITVTPVMPSIITGLQMLSPWQLFIPILILLDKIEKKENFKKATVYAMLFVVIITIIIIAVPYGVFGYSLVSKMSAPFMNSSKEISFMGIFERIDSLIVVFWIFTDFIQTSVIIYAGVHLIKRLFNIEKINPLLYIYSVVLFYLCLGFASSSFEMAKVGENFLFIPGLIITFAIPLVLFVVGKIRKKI